MRAEVIRDRFLGSLFGLAIGDALGSPYEGQTGAVLRMRLEAEDLDLSGSADRGLRPGEWGDDTAQALLLAESLTVLQDFDALDLAARLVEWHRTQPKGPGDLTRRVLRILDNDLDLAADAARSCWYESAGTETDCGALSRALVAGLYFHEDIHKLVDRTIQACRLTHFDPRCIEAALALNFALVQFLHGRMPDNLPAQLLAFLEATRASREWRRQVLDIDRGILARHPNHTPLPSYHEFPDEVTEAIRRFGRYRYEDLRTTGRAADAAVVAIWCARRAAGFEEAVRMAVLLGGKADTQGALAGGLAGARFGLASIPGDWVTRVRNSAKLRAIGEVLLGKSLVADERDFAEGRREPARKPPRVV